jgi:hypothetical protein
MNRDDIIRMAEEAELLPTNIGPTAETRAKYALLEHFAALIEQHLSHDGIHTCSDQCQRPACVATRRAVAREREACAKVCDEHWRFNGSASECAAAIRARGAK